MASTKANNGGITEGAPPPKQRVIVMRHGARLDSADPNWEVNAGKDRPYDTPLTERGRQEAYRIACNRYKNMGISVVISSPFLRCLQTAQEACRAIGLPGIVINNSICEVLSPGSKMRTSPVVPASDITSYGISILEYDEKPLPQFPETTFKAIERYLKAVPAIADKYNPNNILIVTHQYGVEQAATLALGTRESYEASYCGHVVLLRDGQLQNSSCEDDGSTSARDVCKDGSKEECKWTLESKYRVDPYMNLC